MDHQRLAEKCVKINCTEKMNGCKNTIDQKVKWHRCKSEGATDLKKGKSVQVKKMTADG